MYQMGRGPRGDVLCLPKITCTPWFHALVGPGDNEADWKCLGPLDWMSRSCTSSNLNYYRNDLPSNRTLPSSWNPHFQNEAKYTTFLVKNEFHLYEIEKSFSYLRVSTKPRFYRGPGELGNGPLLILYSKGKLSGTMEAFSNDEVSDRSCPLSF